MKDERKDIFLEQFIAMPETIKQFRSYDEVSKEMEKLWRLNPTSCVRLTAAFKHLATNVKDTFEDVQDFSLVNEGILRLFWIASKQKATFAANVAYFIEAGSWEDIFSLMVLDITTNGWNSRKLDWVLLKSVIIAGLVNEDSIDEVKKYLPSIKSSNELTTDTAKANNEIGKFLSIGFYGKPENEGDFSSYKKYRKLKSNGIASEFLQVAKKNNLLTIDFVKKRGRSLSLLAGKAYLTDTGIYPEYSDWVLSWIPKWAKFDICEIFKPCGPRHMSKKVNDYEKWVIEAKFQNIMKEASQNPKISTSTLVVRDISSSNEGIIQSMGTSSYAIAKSLTLFFSTLNNGYFHDKYLVFTENKCELREFRGEYAYEKYVNDAEIIYSENNSLQLVSEYFESIKPLNISEGEMPREILIISDELLTVESLDGFKADMIKAGYSENYVNNLKVIILSLPNELGPNDEAVSVKEICENLTHIVGFDGSVLLKLTGLKPGKTVARTSKEYFNEVMRSMPYRNMVAVQYKNQIKFTTTTAPKV